MRREEAGSSRRDTSPTQGLESVNLEEGPVSGSGPQDRGRHGNGQIRRGFRGQAMGVGGR